MTRFGNEHFTRQTQLYTKNYFGKEFAEIGREYKILNISLSTQPNLMK
jgi:hypothetical protein